MGVDKEVDTVTEETDLSLRGVVVHLDDADPGVQAMAVNNIVNLLRDLGASTPVELVLNGPGLSAGLAESPRALEIHDLLARGVSVAACANTMRAGDVTPDRLASGVVVVTSGVGQLVRRQREGWAYLRP